MDQTIDTPRALAEIHFQNEWNLPGASDIHPLRYWAHVHFEDDPKWGKERWTLFIELEKPPESGAQVYLATIFFVAPSAPFHFFGWSRNLNYA